MTGTTTRRTVAKAALKIVQLSDLQTDTTYQRDVKSGHKRIIAEFNEDALGIPLVGERNDGSLWIVDGQQRITALRKMERKTVRAEVFNSRGSEHEAAVYKLVNMNRSRLTPIEEYRALLAAHDGEAWALKEAAESLGYTVMQRKQARGNPENDATKLTCINTLLGVVRRVGYGIEPVKFTLSVIREAWPGDKLGVYNVVIGGMCRFWKRMRGTTSIDRERLINRLSRTTPQKIVYAAGLLSIHSDRTEGVAIMIEKTYRSRENSRRGS